MDSFVTCGGLDCSVCSLLEGVSVTFRWLLGISAVIASLVITLGGIAYLLRGANKNYVASAKKTVTYVVTGFIFVLIAFISVHTFIWTIGGSSHGSWWKFECSVSSEKLLSDEKSPLQNRPFANNFPLISEIEDEASVLTNIASLNRLAENKNKIVILKIGDLESQNLRQDLLNLRTGEEIRFLAGSKDASIEELQAFTKLQNGYMDSSVSQYNLKDLLSKFQGVADFRRDDGDLTISTSGVDAADISGSYWGLDSDLSSILDRIVNLLTQRTSQNIIAYKNARAEGSLSSCIDSGGDWKEFYNECSARKQIHGKEKIKCSNINNPTMGCQCPKGKFLINGSCIGNEDSLTDEDEASFDYCDGMALQKRTCPATRCEGNNLVTYPESGEDECINEVVNEYSCSATNIEYNATCEQMKNVNNLTDKENIAKKDPKTYNKLKDSFNRNNPDNAPDNWGNKSESGSGKNTGGGDRTNGGNNTVNGNNTGGTPPPDLGPGNYNPTPSAEELAKCIGFKDGKIPYNGVLVLLLNKDDPTNAKHPNNNASRLFYLDRYGNLIGNNGDKNAGGLKVGPWTKGSGGTAWSPEWVIFNAQTVHTSNRKGSPDPWSFRSGQGRRVGPKGENMNHDGTINPNGKIQNMSGCNMHSGNSRSHSSGCMTMGGNERKGFTDYVKKMATQSNNNVLMAVLPADNTDQNSQKVSSEYCGQMDSYAAINKFKTLSQYRNYDPMQGYSTARIFSPLIVSINF